MVFTLLIPNIKKFGLHRSLLRNDLKPYDMIPYPKRPYSGTQRIVFTKGKIVAYSRMSKSALLEIHIFIDNNSDSVRGQKRVSDDLQLFQSLQKIDASNYTRKVYYKSEYDLDTIANDIIQEAHRLADLRDCYIEVSIYSKELDKSWD